MEAGTENERGGLECRGGGPRIRCTFCPKGPSTEYLGTWDLGNRNSSTGFGEVCNY